MKFSANSVLVNNKNDVKNIPIIWNKVVIKNVKQLIVFQNDNGFVLFIMINYCLAADNAELVDICE